MAHLLLWSIRDTLKFRRMKPESTKAENQILLFQNQHGRQFKPEVNKEAHLKLAQTVNVKSEEGNKLSGQGVGFHSLNHALFFSKVSIIDSYRLCS